MMTPQDIREKQFERAVLNGYSPTSVDEFMEEIAVEYNNLCKEISNQRKKMKVLVEEIEKYRDSEKAMRMALLQTQKTCDELTAAAQRTAQSTLETAQKQAEELSAKVTAESEAILASAQRQYDDMVGGIAADAEKEEARLAAAQRSSAQFIENMRKLCTRQLQYFDAFSGLVPLEEDSTEEPPAELAISDPEETIVPEEASASPEEAALEMPVEEAEVPELDAIPESEESDPFGDETAEPEGQAKETDESADAFSSEEEDSLSQLMNTLFSEENEAPEGNEDTTKRFNFDDLNGLNFGR